MAQVPLLDDVDAEVALIPGPAFDPVIELATNDDGERELENTPGFLDDDSDDGLAMLSELHWLQATALVEDAVLRRAGEEGLDEESLRWYRFYVSPWVTRGFYFAVAMNLALVLFEKPAVFALPRWLTYMLELATLGAFAGQMMMQRRFSGNKSGFLRDFKHVGLLAVLGLTLVDMLLALFLYEFRFSRVLRVYFVSYNSVFVRSALRNIRRTIPRILDVVFLMMFFTLVTSIVFTIMFTETSGGDLFFSSFWQGFLTLYIMRTTSNFPRVLAHFFSSSAPWTVVLFVAYVIVALYLLTSLALAVVYQQYQTQLKNEELRALKRQQKLLAHAFGIISAPSSRGLVSRRIFIELMKRLRPRWVHDKVELSWRMLACGAPRLSLSKFVALRDVLKLQFFELRVESSDSPQPSLAALQRAVRSKAFNYAIDALVVLNVIVIAIQVSRDRAHPHDLSSVEGRISLAFTAFYAVEAGLRLYAFGARTFFQDNWNRFDVVLLIASVLDAILVLLNRRVATDIFKFLLVLRVARLWATIGSFERFRVLLATLSDFLPTLSVYTMVFLMVFYVYAIIGMELFAKRISRGAPGLVDTLFAEEGFYPFTMDNFVNTILVLFCLNVGESWDAFAAGYVGVTSQWSWIYFLSFNLIAGVVVTNIVIAFVLEAFILQWDINVTGVLKVSSDDIVDVSATTSLDARWRAEPVRDMDYFLRRMFWAELTEQLRTERSASMRGLSESRSVL